ncbi:hypothetical protein F3Y22_tig00002237pilonHSYRG00039 [Hibiscus syriacus]|uniref:Uncharacterized protein n=1 Tax=Hibiscus syriacus TaxID=106335 RepID=A0A6A3CSN0_HIBSY|nr:hypothetical protein F3Y22_tig00002237pilonHSYRG00039 [Hibiscus syriacus]
MLSLESMVVPASGTRRRNGDEDHAGLPIITLRRKAMSWKKKWQIHEGESSEQSMPVQRATIRCTSDQERPRCVLSKQLQGGWPRFLCDWEYHFAFFQGLEREFNHCRCKHNYTWGKLPGKRKFQGQSVSGGGLRLILALVVIMHESENV